MVDIQSPTAEIRRAKKRRRRRRGRRRRRRNRMKIYMVSLLHRATINKDKNVSALQSDLCNLVELSKEWQMLFKF